MTILVHLYRFLAGFPVNKSAAFFFINENGKSCLVSKKKKMTSLSPSADSRSHTTQSQMPAGLE
jgi:hypothetical protein